MKTQFLLLLLALASLLGAEKLTLQKHFSNRPPRRHPFTQLLTRQAAAAPQTRDANFDRLLVILVDFAEESTDDPNTTGNGKFLLEPDPNYLYNIGSPPHDQAYFLQNLEAMRHYYLAASAGSYNLQYEVWPQSGTYTLPQTMGWYNPPGADNELFVSRMEEYFKTAFELADSLSPELDFSTFGHFMIIHAGSDWQHDVFGDTPSDIPSFFIRVGDGKEAVVDEGSVLIGKACNVPATISQDYASETSGENVFRSGYGALNAVLCHEFGHSLGFVDLYNVYTWQPMVGVFDIMDSGGSGILMDVLDDGSYVLLEGALPGLPGAWSRELVFGDDLRSRGLLKDADKVGLFSEMALAASSHRQPGNKLIPQILRLPLSPTEYLLVENRSVDPDGDGATALKASDDGRVILYPTAIDDPQNVPTYEYDYLLPSFQREDGSSVGGGILAWRVNEDVIYAQGATGSDGTFYSNYENNTINTRYNRRGVEIIEADNLPDIGYEWSWYWTGTQYEYFHAKKPVLDESGYFAGWSLQAWKPDLNGNTKPPLEDSAGMGSLYWLGGMGNPGAIMNLTVNSGWFDDSSVNAYGIPDLLPGPFINSSYSILDLPLIGPQSITLLSHHDGQWTDLMGPFAWDGEPLDQPVIRADQDGNGYQELILSHANSLKIVEFSLDDLQSKSVNYPDPISTAPLALRDTVFVSTSSCLSSVVDNVVKDMVQLPGIKRLGSYGTDLVALSQDLLHIIDTSDLYIKLEVELPEPFGEYEPVGYTADSDGVRMLFLMANSGSVYKFQNNHLERIWLNTLAAKPTQLGVTWYTNEAMSRFDLAVDPTVFWGCGNRIYAMKHDGTLLSGFPYNAYPLNFSPRNHVYALNAFRNTLLCLPVPEHGHVAYSSGGYITWDDDRVWTEGIVWPRSLLTNGPVNGSRLATAHYSTQGVNLFWYYADPDGRLSIHKKELSTDFQGVFWNGFRNGGEGNFKGFQMEDDVPTGQDFNAFVFPNPVRDPQFRVRVEDFDKEVELRLYDINGSLLQDHTLPANGILRRDVALDSGRLASGVYILFVRKGAENKRIKFAVEK